MGAEPGAQSLGRGAWSAGAEPATQSLGRGLGAWSVGVERGRGARGRGAWARGLERRVWGVGVGPKRQSLGRGRGAWSVERGAWSVERGAWSVRRGSAERARPRPSELAPTELGRQLVIRAAAEPPSSSAPLAMPRFRRPGRRVRPSRRRPPGWRPRRAARRVPRRRGRSRPSNDEAGRPPTRESRERRSRVPRRTTWRRRLSSPSEAAFDLPARSPTPAGTTARARRTPRGPGEPRRVPAGAVLRHHLPLLRAGAIVSTRALGQCEPTLPGPSSRGAARGAGSSSRAQSLHRRICNPRARRSGRLGEARLPSAKVWSPPELPATVEVLERLAANPPGSGPPVLADPRLREHRREHRARPAARQAKRAGRPHSHSRAAASPRECGPRLARGRQESPAGLGQATRARPRTLFRYCPV